MLAKQGKKALSESSVNKISAGSGNSSTVNITTHSKARNANINGKQAAVGSENQEKAGTPQFHEDVFKAKTPAQNNSGSNPFSKSPLGKSAGVVQNVGGNVINASIASQQRVMNSFNALQVNSQAFINNVLSRFVDIMDKISAVYGEKEKDLRDKLSDTFKRMTGKVFELLSPVDASLSQKDHNKEKQLKDEEKKSSDKDENRNTHRVD